jgi:murein DD-endopeptidase MepM/ murein hydrolase activator NlpD
VDLVLGMIMMAVTAASPLIDPPLPKQGDVVALRVVDSAVVGVDAWMNGERIPFYPIGDSWVGIVGFDMLAAPGAREVTGVTFKDGQRRPWRTAFSLADGEFPAQHITLKDETQVHLSQANIERSRRDTAAVVAVFRLRTPRAWEGNFIHPLEGAPQGGRFGHRRVINNEIRNPHSGADYGVPTGTPVRAPNHGTVVLVDDHFFAGQSIFIDHGDGLFTMYFHLSKMLVKKGQKVRKGDIIGQVGSTGRSTGPHLHYGVRYGSARVNPDSLMSRSLEPASAAKPILIKQED